MMSSAVADALPVGIWLLDAHDEILYRNARLAELAPGVESLADLARALPGVPVFDYASEVRGGGAPVEEPAVLLRAGARAQLVQLRIAAGPPALPGTLLVTFEPVSERLRLERLRALAETTVALCHEINNPLAILSGEIELLRRDGGAPAARVSAMQGAVGRIAEVLRQLRRAAEPLEADYLPSRGVRMLDLRGSGKGKEAA